jgi:hypothetical protein
VAEVPPQATSKRGKKNGFLVFFIGAPPRVERRS